MKTTLVHDAQSLASKSANLTTVNTECRTIQDKTLGWGLGKNDSLFLNL